VIDRDYSYFNQQLYPQITGGNPQFNLRGVLWKNYKYIYDPATKIEILYNLENDSAEQHNIATEVSTITEQLRAALANFQTNAKVASPAQDTPQVDDETLKRLKGLGYVK
jgi:arylsulfatase A-like enzyme